MKQRGNLIFFVTLILAYFINGEFLSRSPFFTALNNVYGPLITMDFPPANE